MLFWVVKLGLPYVAAADWQHTPEEFAGSPWATLMQGVICHTGEGTCKCHRLGTTRNIDWFFVSASLAPSFGTAEQCQSGLATHTLGRLGGKQGFRRSIACAPWSARSSSPSNGPWGHSSRRR